MSDRDQNMKHHDGRNQRRWQNRSFDPYDRFETIEFTKEDLEALRHPNPQPLDSDYFTEEQEGLRETREEDSQQILSDEGPEQDNLSTSDREFTSQLDPLPGEEEVSSTYGPSSFDDSVQVPEHAREIDASNEDFSDIWGDGEAWVDESGHESTPSFEDLDEKDEEMPVDRLGSREHLQETLNMDLEDQMFERHDFSHLDAESSEENPFAYRSIQKELRDRQAYQRVHQAKPGFMQGIMQTIFRTRADEEAYQPIEPEEADFTDMMAETLTELSEEEGSGHVIDYHESDMLESEEWVHEEWDSTALDDTIEPMDSEDQADLQGQVGIDEENDLELSEQTGSEMLDSDQAISQEEGSLEEWRGTPIASDWEEASAYQADLQPKTQMYDDDDLEELAADLPEYHYELEPKQPSKLQQQLQKSQHSLERGWQQFTDQSRHFWSGIKQKAENVVRTESDQEPVEEAQSEALHGEQDESNSEQQKELLGVDSEPTEQDLDGKEEDPVTPDQEAEEEVDDPVVEGTDPAAKDPIDSSAKEESIASDELMESISNDDIEASDGSEDSEDLKDSEDSEVLKDSEDSEVLKDSEDLPGDNSDLNDSLEDQTVPETGLAGQEKKKKKDKVKEDPKALAERISQETQQYQEPLLSDSILESYTLPPESLSVDEAEAEQDTSKSSFVSNAAWLSFGSIFSRIIGALYIIPWATWLGAEYTHANSLYAVGYTPYAYFIAIATAGFPGAVAKQIAYYNSKKEFKVSDKLFKYSLLVMLVTGMIAASIFFFAAPALAIQSSTDNPAAAVVVIRSLAPALLILPMMSLTRGYFQGFNNMMPFAISEIIEQVLRVLYILGSTYLIMQVYHGSVTQAVAHSTFAAFVGAVGSVIFLIIVYIRHLPVINQLKEVSEDKIQIDFKQSIQMMLRDSIPFILLGSGIILAQVIDTFTFKQILVRTSVLLTSEIAELFGAMNLDVNKLVMIVVSLAVAMAGSSIPAVSSKFAQGNVNKTSELIKNIVLVFALVMLPAAVGMAVIANNLYPFFYPAGLEIGPQLLVTGSIMAIALGAYTVLATILQSMSYRRAAVTYLLIGIGIKAILQFPMVAMFRAHGAMFATTIAFAVISVMMWMKIWRVIKIRDRYFVGDLIRIVIATTLMGIGASAWNRTLNFIMDPVGRGLTLVQILIVIVVAVFIYFGVLALFGMLSILIGDRHATLQERLSIGK